MDMFDDYEEYLDDDYESSDEEVDEYWDDDFVYVVYASGYVERRAR